MRYRPLRGLHLLLRRITWGLRPRLYSSARFAGWGHKIHLSGHDGLSELAYFGVMKTLNTDVIIIGAGPTGLSLACQFIRYGIDFVVVEKNDTVTRFSKAIGVQARTLEIYDQLGLAQPAIECGAIADRARLIEGGEALPEKWFWLISSAAQCSGGAPCL